MRSVAWLLFPPFAICRYTDASSGLQDEKVINLATKFDLSSATGRPYTVITPDTPLETLEIFLQKNLFALGMSSHCSLQCLILNCSHSHRQRT
jgi:hypothetical protein